MKKPIVTDEAPAAVGAYSQGIISDNAIYVSGQLPLNPKTGVMADDITSQATQALDNVKAILNAAGSSMDRVLKATVLLSDISDFQEVNKVYETYFKEPYPARACFAAAALPKGAKVEIEVIAEPA